MQVIRAANEGGGKTTTSMGVGLLMRFLEVLPRAHPEESVTWGEDQKTLKVKVTLTLNGDTYIFSRSKGGAEVLKNGTVFVTGQKGSLELLRDLARGRMRRPRPS